MISRNHGSPTRICRLVGAYLYRSDAQGTDLSGTDRTGSSLVRVNLDDATGLGQDDD
ncbi:pentapeptide repeat-containing protein [Streptomyces sp. NPDC051104]|uniref:pentapeptide repeat-containing protein n=1 Tax=Streptomyces sp. NPDC051104 TaxID=3155044 RepID=UPI00343A380D